LNQPGEIATITATYSSTSGPISDDVDVICAGNIYEITMTADPVSPISGISSTTITAYLTVNGAPVADGTLIFFSEIGDDSSIAPASDLTSSGNAETVLTFTALGSSIVTATYIPPVEAIVSESIVVIKN
jgi:hypothetical protein